MTSSTGSFQRDLSRVLADALRTTAARLDAGAGYQWGHLGQCNCGHLVQTVCGLDREVIHRWALDGAHLGVGDWEQLANDYCPTSGHPIDDVIASLLAVGMTRDDLGHLEQLDDPRVLDALTPAGEPRRWLRRNDRADVVLYMAAWAQLLDPEAAPRACAEIAVRAA